MAELSTTTIFGDLSLSGNFHLNGNTIDSDGNGVRFAEEIYVDDSEGIFVEGEDLAENYHSKQDLEEGTLVKISKETDNSVVRTQEKFDFVAGVVSTKPGYTLGKDNNGEEYYSIALTGKIPVKVTVENGEIERGDYLVPSSKPGVAMKAEIKPVEDAEDFKEYKKIAENNRKIRDSKIGKALEPAKKDGNILVKVN